MYIYIYVYNYIIYAHTQSNQRFSNFSPAQVFLESDLAMSVASARRRITPTQKTDMGKFSRCFFIQSRDICFLGKQPQSLSVFPHATRSTAEAHIHRSLAAGPSVEFRSSSDRLAFHFWGSSMNMDELLWTCMNMYEHVWTCMNAVEHVWTYWLMETTRSSKQNHIWKPGIGTPQEVLLPLPCAPWEIVSSLAEKGCPIQICRYGLYDAVDLQCDVRGLFSCIFFMNIISW